MTVLLAGCASAKVTPVDSALLNAKPDSIVIYDFGVSPDQIKLDRGFAPAIAREMDGRPQTEEEVRVGKVVAQALSRQLVTKLQKKAFVAKLASDGARPSSTTLVIKGYFLRVDEGDQNLRAVIGFGFGGTKVQTHVFLYQNDRLLGDAYTTADSGLKPGMAVSVLGGPPGMAISAGTTAVNEKFIATVEGDARRTADKIAKRIDEAFRERGW